MIVLGGFIKRDVSRDKITGTITDTLRRKRRKSKVVADTPSFLFVNKPHFSSAESLHEPSPAHSAAAAAGSSREVSPRPSPPRARDRAGKRYRSEMTLRIPSR